MDVKNFDHFLITRFNLRREGWETNPPDTLNTYKENRDTGKPINTNSFPNLNSDEQELFQFVKADNINTIRLEQEKISHEYVLKALGKLYETI